MALHIIHAADVSPVVFQICCFFCRYFFVLHPSKEVEDAAFLSWAKPTSDTPEHIKETAIAAIKNGLVGGYSENSGLLELRKEIVKKLKRDNNIDANTSQIMVTVG
jgi:aspartate/methionine/tyrosine aminotransferase